MKPKAPFGRKENLVIQEVENEILIYDLKKNEAFCLNETSAFIWKMCDGKNSTVDISQAVKKKFKTNIDDGFIWLALDQLKKNDLIETEPEVPASFLGMSRRQVIRQIGLSSMVMLPVVASVISPTSVQAQSCIAVDGICTASPQCCNMNCNTSPAPGNRCCVPAAGPDSIAGVTVSANIDAGTNGLCPGPGVPPAGVIATCNTFAPVCCPGNASTAGNCNDGGRGMNDTFNCVCV